MKNSPRKYVEQQTVKILLAWMYVCNQLAISLTKFEFCDRWTISSACWTRRWSHGQLWNQMGLSLLHTVTAWLALGKPALILLPCCLLWMYLFDLETAGHRRCCQPAGSFRLPLQGMPCKQNAARVILLHPRPANVSLVQHSMELQWKKTQRGRQIMSQLWLTVTLKLFLTAFSHQRLEWCQQCCHWCLNTQQSTMQQHHSRTNCQPFWGIWKMKLANTCISRIC